MKTQSLRITMPGKRLGNAVHSGPELGAASAPCRSIWCIPPVEYMSGIIYIPNFGGISKRTQGLMFSYQQIVKPSPPETQKQSNTMSKNKLNVMEHDIDDDKTALNSNVKYPPRLQKK